MIVAKKFDDWMKKTENTHADHNKALVDFLTLGKGFAIIKNYVELCELAKVVRETYGYQTSNLPCTELEYGRAVLNAPSDVFSKMIPILPESVKLILIAEKFCHWAKESPQRPYEELLQAFLHIEGILEHISNYQDFCLLATTIQEVYGYPLSHPPCPELAFYQAVFEAPAPYLGALPLEIPDHIVAQLIQK